MSFLNWKTVLLAGFTLVLLVAIPITLYTLQQPTDNRTQAIASTTLSIVSPSETTLAPKVGDTFSVDFLVNPGNNQVTIIDTEITYDAEALEPATPSAHTSTLTDGRFLLLEYPDTQPVGKLNFQEGPNFTTPGKIVSILASGTSIENIIQTPSRIARITFKAKKVGTTTIGFGPNSEVNSYAGTDQTLENVFSSANPLAITITQTSADVTPTATPSGTITNKPPTCTSFVLDRTATGPAPFAVTFTATGNDSDGTISKATFNFGNGPVRDVTTGNGIGTNSVSIPLSNSYPNAGTYQASIIFTDNQGGVSTTGTCTQTITVTQPVVPTSPPIVQNPTAIPTEPIAQVQPTVQPIENPQPIAPTGPGETFTILGGVVTIITIIGGILFFSL